jgi:hypothetical protein
MHMQDQAQNSLFLEPHWVPLQSLREIIVLRLYNRYPRRGNPEKFPLKMIFRFDSNLSSRLQSIFTMNCIELLAESLWPADTCCQLTGRHGRLM